MSSQQPRKKIKPWVAIIIMKHCRSITDMQRSVLVRRVSGLLDEKEYLQIAEIAGGEVLEQIIRKYEDDGQSVTHLKRALDRFKTIHVSRKAIEKTQNLRERDIIKFTNKEETTVAPDLYISPLERNVIHVVQPEQPDDAYKTFRVRIPIEGGKLVRYTVDTGLHGRVLIRFYFRSTGAIQTIRTEIFHKYIETEIDKKTGELILKYTI